MGVELARNQNPDHIILDIMMPKMDGHEVARTLKSDSKLSGIPILMLTVQSQKRDRESGFDAGGDAYMTKPYKPDELLEKITELL